MAILSRQQRALVQTIACRVVPDAARLAPPDMARLIDLVDEALAERPPGLRRQFAALLSVLKWMPVLRYGRPFDRLAPDRQDAVLQRVQGAPAQKLRSGFWGLRTLIYLGYYGRPEIGPLIAYTPSRDGHVILHDRAHR